MRLAGFGLTFALGALTAIGLGWYGGEPKRDLRHASEPAAHGTPSIGPPTRPPSGSTTTATDDPKPTATAGPSRDELVSPDDRDLYMPVDDVLREDLRDTFTELRDGVRPHEALDIMAPRGTPVRAVRDGHIEKLFTSKAGGLTIYQFEPSGAYAYYYAHLDRYAPGLKEGQAVSRGELIGYVGSTGNASPEAPHLHFAVFRLGPERRWWEGLALNPYPLLK